MNRFRGRQFRFKRTKDHALAVHSRSGLEDKVIAQLKGLGVPFEYEKLVIEYDVPQRKAKYKPDFRLDNSIIIETKGEFDSEDRQKHLLVKEARPDLDIRFVFSNPHRFIASQKTPAFRAWLLKEHGIKVLSTKTKEHYKPIWLATLEKPPSQTTYAMWCEKHGFKYAKGEIPQAWIDEKPKKPKACSSKAAHVMCANCDCWKQTRATCA